MVADVQARKTSRDTLELTVMLRDPKGETGLLGIKWYPRDGDKVDLEFGDWVEVVIGRLAAFGQGGRDVFIIANAVSGVNGIAEVDGDA